MMERRVGPAALVLVLAACALPPEMAGPGSAGPAGGDGVLPPPGYGTLRQSEISISLTSAALQVLVTPLAESVTRVTAPDTYARLSGIAAAHRADAPADSHLFLVSFYSAEPSLRFMPDEVQIISRGLRARPIEILPITPTWGQNRVEQRRAEMAVYAFGSSIDLESELVLAYGFDETTAWGSILPRIQAERGRARARAGVGR